VKSRNAGAREAIEQQLAQYERLVEAAHKSSNRSLTELEVHLRREVFGA
jgi:hypothetical protein